MRAWLTILTPAPLSSTYDGPEGLARVTMPRIRVRCPGKSENEKRRSSSIGWGCSAAGSGPASNRRTKSGEGT